MLSKLFIPLLFICSYSFAQQPLTAEQINRLADAGKVYGYIKYFHPWLQYKDINWDSTFAANVGGIINAKDKNEYADVMQKLLSTLNDGLTIVVNGADEKSTYKIQPLAYFIKDSILYVNINDAPDDSTYDKLQEALRTLQRAKGVIFDMRKPVNSKYTGTTATGLLIDWSPLYFQGDFFDPAIRTVSYTGLPGILAGYTLYEPYFKERMLSRTQGYAKTDIPIVFIVADEEQIPALSYQLQQKGKAAIIQEEGRDLLAGTSLSFYIHDSILIKMRTGELINPDGTLGIVHPNATYSSNENPADAVSKAEQLILNGFPKYTFTTQTPLPGIGHQADYMNDNSYPSLGYRMLAAAKIFSEIDHFFAHKKIMDKNWEESYRAMIPKFIEAKDSLEYLRAVAELYSNIDDSHGFIARVKDEFSLRLNPIIQGRGNYIPPVFTSVIENKVMISGIYNDSVCKSIGISKGDILLSIDGKDPMQMIDDVRKYQNASNKASQTFFICNFLLFGQEGQAKNLKVQDAKGKIKNIIMPLLKEYDGNFYSDDYTLGFYSRHNKPTFYLITKDIGYADITSPISGDNIDSMFKLFKNTKAIIFDVRGFPHSSYSLFDKFAQNPDAIIAKFSVPAPSSPNVKATGYEATEDEDNHVSKDRVNFKKGGWIYPGKVVMLINEIPQSAGEYVCMTLKAMCNATFIGSHTAGANSNLTDFNIPGSIKLWLSGANVMHPDGKSMQRVGLQPDIFVRPTIKGIQSGKDEVLERAIKYLQTGK